MSRCHRTSWEHLTATVRAFASPAITDLFTQWGEASKVTWEKGAAQEARQQAYHDAGLAQRSIQAQVVSELQGRDR